MDNADRRRAATELIERYFALLGEEHREQVYQKFLEEHTQLIPREFVQNHGISLSIILRKLRFGGEYVSDFFYASKSSDDWNLVFIEIEKPHSRYFRDGSNDFHPDFTLSLQQINRWRAWMSNSSNAAHLYGTTVEPLILPPVMKSNPFFAKFVLVHGRRSELSGNVSRQALVRAQERDDFKIMSFDGLVEQIAYKPECYIGVRRNEYIDLLGHRVVSPNLFGWIEPTQFRVTRTMRAAIRASAEHGPVIRRSDGKNFFDAFGYVADRILVRPDDAPIRGDDEGEDHGEATDGGRPSTGDA